MTIPEWMAASEAYIEANGGGKARSKSGAAHLSAPDVRRLTAELRAEKAKESERGPDA